MYQYFLGLAPPKLFFFYLRVDYVNIEESFHTIININNLENASIISPIEERVNK